MRRQVFQKFQKTINNYEFFLFATVFNPDIGLALFGKDFEREMLDIGLHLSIVKFAPNETFRIEDTKEKNKSETSQVVGKTNRYVL